MWFPERCRQLTEVDIAELREAVLNLDETDWLHDESLRAKLAGKDRPTRSIFFYGMESSQFNAILIDRPLVQADVQQLEHGALSKLVDPLIKQSISFLSPGGVTARVQLARMLPGTTIAEHYDSAYLLSACHRMHIPIVTNNKVRFIVDGERVVMSESMLYELNNQLLHSVENPKNATQRIHLIIDYLPPENNEVGVLENFYLNKIKARRAQKPKKNVRKKCQLPTVIATSVVRGAHKEQSHGGVFIIDLDSETAEQVVDWNNCDIDFSGRGWDRGLRGISIVGSSIFIAATDAIYEFDKNFNILSSFKNAYLRHAHEMVVDGRHLYITSTGFDAVLSFDLNKKVYDKGWSFTLDEENMIQMKRFDPTSRSGPEAFNCLHLNNVCMRRGVMYISGRLLPALIRMKSGKVSQIYGLPLGTHNAIPMNKGVLYNDSANDQIVYSSNYDFRRMEVPRYKRDQIINKDLGDELVARQSFGRGLCVWENGMVIGGSSPSTVSAYDLRSSECVKSVNFSMDIRNAVHGLELWPF